MGGQVSSTTTENYMQAQEQTAMSTALYPPKVWERFADDTFHHINNFHQNTKFTMEEESNGELAFLDTLLKRHNRNISVLVYRKPKDSDQYLRCSSHDQASWKKNIVSSFTPY